MILVDTSIWVDHLRSGHAGLARLLEAGLVLIHPWVIGELALGSLGHRREVLGLLHGLPTAAVATADEVLTLVESERLYGLGIGYVDAQLLAASRLTADARALDHGQAPVRSRCAFGLRRRSERLARRRPAVAGGGIP